MSDPKAVLAEHGIDVPDNMNVLSDFMTEFSCMTLVVENMRPTIGGEHAD